MRKNVLIEIGPDPTGLLADLSTVIDDSMLIDISQADYGEDATEHLFSLRKIRDEQVCAKMEWCPREVLELIRWSDPEDPECKPGFARTRGHLMRVFCCAALLHAAAVPENSDVSEGENQTLAQLLDSLRHLDTSAYTLSAAKLVAYRLINYPQENEERPFFILALLILSLRTHLSENLVSELSSWLIEDEGRIATASWANYPEADRRWLLGLTFYDIRHSSWVAMNEELRTLASNLTETIRRVVLDIAERLTHDSSLKSDAAKPRTLG